MNEPSRPCVVSPGRFCCRSGRRYGLVTDALLVLIVVALRPVPRKGKVGIRHPQRECLGAARDAPLARHPQGPGAATGGGGVARSAVQPASVPGFGVAGVVHGRGVRRAMAWGAVAPSLALGARAVEVTAREARDWGREVSSKGGAGGRYGAVTPQGTPAVEGGGAPPPLPFGDDCQPHPMRFSSP